MISLTPQQEKAIQYIDTPLLIVAAPGTGKTRVIIQKIIYLVDELGYDPNRLLVSTFTIKAANELKERLRVNLGDKVENMQISTIHSFCRTMLETFPEQLSFGNLFEVMDELDQFLFVNKHYWGFGLREFIGDIDPAELVTFYNKATENNVDPDELVKYVRQNGCTKMQRKIAESYRIYLELLLDANNTRLDFGLLQREFYHLLLNNTDILEHVRHMYDYILIDEYQDTNPIQDAIFRLIAEPRYQLTAVGDEDQSIYGFRGASLKNFRDFLVRYPKAEKLFLDINFRSTVEIVKTFDRFMAPYRIYDKHVRANKDGFSKPILLTSKGLDEEGITLAKFVLDLHHNKEVRYEDIAILFKSVKSHSRPIRQAFQDYGIPFIVHGDSSLLAQDVVLDMIILMGLVCEYPFSEYDKKHLFRYNFLQSNLLNLEEQTVSTLNNYVDQYALIKDVSVARMVNSRISDKDVQIFRDLKALAQEQKIEGHTFLELFYRLLDITGYHASLFVNYNEDKELELKRLAELSKLINKIDLNTNVTKYKGFLSNLLKIPDSTVRDAPHKDTPNAVQMMTIHQAKGLEFPVVIMAGVTNRRYNYDPPAPKYVVEIPKAIMMDQTDFDAAGELRRSFYVGLSRAKEILAVSTVDDDYNKPSVFIDEIGVDHFIPPDAFIQKAREHYEPPTEKVRLSFSSISTYINCPFRFYLVDILGFQSPTTYFQLYGSIVHNCLRKMHIMKKEGKAIRTSDTIRIVDIYCKTDKMKEKWRTELITDLSRYNKKMQEYIKEVVDVERPYSYIQYNMITNGQVDLVIRNKQDQLEIVDFKSRYEHGLKEMNVDTQLRMYKMALSNIYEEPVQAISAYTFKDNHRVPFSCTEEDLTQTEGLVREVSDAIEEGQFARKWGSPFCSPSKGKCFFYGLCKIIEENRGRIVNGGIKATSHE